MGSYDGVATVTIITLDIDSSRPQQSDISALEYVVLDLYAVSKLVGAAVIGIGDRGFRSLESIADGLYPL